MERALEMIKQYGPLVARVLLAYIFVLSGSGKIAEFAGTAGYMASQGMPFAELFLVGAIILEIGGGLSVALGWKARWGALALIVFTLPTTLIFHPYWAVEAAQAQMQMIQFNKNLAIMGGLLYVMAFGAGPLGLDSRRS